MRTARLLRTLVPAAALLAVALFAHTASAQVGTKVAVANPSKIFNEMKETKALQAKMLDEQKKFVTTQKEKQGQLEEIKRSRDALNPTHPQYEELNNQLLKASLEYKVWVESQKLMAEHTQKKQMKALFDKIQAAVAEVATKGGYDLVIADSNKDSMPNDQELEQITMQQLRAAILSKDVLFNNPKMDISDAVLALLDSKYTGPSPAAVAPAPLVNPATPR
jgi:Skp family chaperone for outer membrane proteins